jgi:hypothetical protein
MIESLIVYVEVVQEIRVPAKDCGDQRMTVDEGWRRRMREKRAADRYKSEKRAMDQYIYMSLKLL